jgi:hypothetical protein
MTKLKKMDDVHYSLSTAENDALDKWERGKRPQLSITTVAKYYELYLQGCSTEDIARLNPGVDLGAIVHAKIEYGWDLEKSKYVLNLTNNIKEQAVKTHLESVKFLGNVIALTHMRFDEKLKKFFQSKDETELGEFSGKDFDLKEYRHNLDLFFRLTGQDARALKASQININVNSGDKVEVEEEDAADFLKELNKKNG